MHFPAALAVVAGATMMATVAFAQTTSPSSPASGSASNPSGGRSSTSTPPIPPPAMEGSSSLSPGSTGGLARSRQPPLPSAVSPTQDQAVLERKSQRIDQMIRRGICDGC